MLLIFDYSLYRYKCLSVRQNLLVERNFVHNTLDDNQTVDSYVNSYSCGNELNYLMLQQVYVEYFVYFRMFMYIAKNSHTISVCISRRSSQFLKHQPKIASVLDRCCLITIRIIKSKACNYDSIRLNSTINIQRNETFDGQKIETRIRKRRVTIISSMRNRS